MEYEGRIDEKKTVIIDRRERTGTIVNALRGFGCHVSTDHLKLGDYHIAPDTIVERKTIDDFCRSIMDGRLFRQAFLLAEGADHPIMILEGESLVLRRYNMGLEAVKGALVSLAQSFRIPLLRSRDQKESAWLLHALALQRARVGTNPGVLNGYRPRQLRTQREYVLRSLPGIGPKLARSLLGEFLNIERIACAGQEELAKVPGLGKKKSHRIHAIFHE